MDCEHFQHSSSTLPGARSTTRLVSFTQPSREPLSPLQSSAANQFIQPFNDTLLAKFLQLAVQASRKWLRFGPMKQTTAACCGRLQLNTNSESLISRTPINSYTINLPCLPLTETISMGRSTIRSATAS